MPADTFFTEDKFSVTNEEQAEILDAFKRDNPTIAENIKKIEIGAGNSSELTATLKYKDDSTSKTYKLKRGLITEKSAIPEIEKVCVTADKIVGKFKIEEGKTLSPDTKVQMIFNFTDGEEKNFCEEENCKFDKSTGYFATVDIQNGTFTIDVKDDQLILGKEFGIVVKEKHKFASCIKAQPSLAIPEKTFVRDPNKLTEAEKTEIETALRKANITESGKSKFPDGTGFLNGIPAIIEYDQKGNVIILNPNDIEVSDWDDAGKPIFVKNPDGSYKLKQGSENNVNKIPVKDLVKNLAPKKPMINVDTDAGKVTVTPPVYVNPGDDTDLASYTVKYKDSSDAEKTVTLTRTVDSKGVTTWGAPAGVTVDKSTGVVTLDIKDLALGATIKATAKDKGGLTQEETPLDSDENQLTLEKVKVTYDPNKGSGTMEVKEINKGLKYKILENKFIAPNENQMFDTWEIDGKRVSPGTEIIITKVTVVKALWKSTPVKVTYDGNGGKGTMDGKTLNKGDTYKVLDSTFTAPDENHQFDTWEIDGKRVAPGTEIVVTKDTVVKALWKKIPVQVTYDGNGGKGTMDGKSLFKGDSYKVLDSTFTAPDENQMFDTWEIDGKRVAPGTEIVVTKDTVVKALWKSIPVKVTYDGNGGKGTMDGKTLNKGDIYKVLASTFTAPDENQMFDTWEIDGKRVAPGEEIVVTKDTVVKALWKKIPVKVTYDGNGGKGTMEGKSLFKGDSYKLLDPTFTAPDENQMFDTWEIDGKRVAPGEEIVVTKDTVVKALWKKIPVKVTYDGNGGKGTMEGKTLNKGDTYKVLASTFTAPNNKKFKAWEVNGKEVSAGIEITVDKDIVVKAIWEDDKKPGTSDGSTSKPGSKDKNGTQSRGTSKLNSRNNGAPSTGDNGMNMLYAFGLAFAACGVIVMNRISRKEKEDLLNESKQ